MSQSHACDQLPQRLREVVRNSDLMVDAYLVLGALRRGVPEPLLHSILSIARNWPGGPDTIEDAEKNTDFAIRAAMDAVAGRRDAPRHTKSSSSTPSMYGRSPTHVFVDDMVDIMRSPRKMFRWDID